MLAILLNSATALTRPRVIIAPAQFGTPKDYHKLVSDLLQRGHPSVRVAPLSRFDWLKIVPSVFTKAFWLGELRPAPTLRFYFEALDEAFADVGDGEDVALLGHSIGGWVLRAYVAARPGNGAKVRRLVTLGTPHNPPPSGFFSAIDQTRGLLSYINANCPPDPAVVTCVAGDATWTPTIFDLFQRRPWEEAQRRSPLLESLVSLPSYAVLAGSGDPFQIKGDGLIPVQTALLAGCPSIVVDAHHADFVPTALESIKLPETYPWFGSDGILDAWADALAMPLAKRP